MSITTSLFQRCRYSTASFATHTHASGSSPLTWNTGAPIIFATSVQYWLDSGCFGGGGEPDLVVDDHVHGAAGAVPAQQREVQRFGDHALAGERGVAVQHQRHHRVALFAVALVEQVLLGPDDPFQDGVDRFEMRRVRRQGDGGLPVAEHAEVLAFGAEVVFDVAGAVGLAGVEVALELAEDLADRLAHDVGQHVEPPAVGHADDDLVEFVFGGLVQHRIQQRDDGLPAFEREAFLPDVLGLQERLERLGRVQLREDVFLFDHRGFLVRHLDAFLQPRPLLGVGDVHVLGADGAHVGVAQQPEHVAQLHVRLPAEPAGGERAVQVPQGQPVGEHVEVGVAALAVVQRVGVGHQMPAGAVGVDQLDHPGGLVDRALGDVGHPPHRLIGHPQRGEDRVVEPDPVRSGPPSSSPCTRRRNSPDSAPWMIRWS